MKNRLLKKLTSLVLVALMVITMIPALSIGISAAENTITLTFSGGSGSNGEYTFTDDASGVSASFTAGNHTTKPRLDSGCIRFYGTATMSNNLTVTAPAGATITKIEFKMDGTYGLTSVSADSGSIDTSTYTWTAGVEEGVKEVVFTTTAQTRFASATITYEVVDGAHVHEYAWNNVAGTDGSHTLTCSNTDGNCDTLTKTEACTWVDGACSVCGAVEPTCKVTFSVPSTLTAPAEVDCPTAGITLPELPYAEGYVSIGWAEAAITGSTKEEPTTYAAGATYTATAATTLFAVYAWAEETEGATVYEKVSAADMVAGDYYLAAQRSSSATNSYYFANGTISSGDIVVTSDAVEAVDGVLSSLPEGAVAFTFTGDATDGFTIQNADGNYLGVTAYSSRKFAFGDYSSIIWKVVDGSEKYDATKNAGNGVYMTTVGENTDGTVAYYLFENSTATGAIRGYATWQSASRPVYLFKETIGTSVEYIYYTEFVAEDHVCADNLTEHEGVQAGCTTAGSAAYWSCTCGKFYSDAAATTEIENDSWIIEATGHTYDNYTSNNDGTHSGTCAVCDTPDTQSCQDSCEFVEVGGNELKCSVCSYTWNVTLYTKVDAVTTINAGDGIVIYYPTGNKLLSGTASGTRLAGVDAKVSGITVAATGGDELFLIVRKDDNGDYYFETTDGQYLTTGSTGNSLSLESELTDYAKWYFDTTGTTATLRIVNRNALYSSSKIQALEYYTYSTNEYFTTYSIADSAAFNLEIYKLEGFSDTTTANPSVEEPTFDGFALSLNKGITVKVQLTISEEWLAANEGAKIVFSNGTELDPVAGTNYYSTDLTPAKINSNLTVTFNGVTETVSFAKYCEKVQNCDASRLGLSENKYEALTALLGKIQDYADAADSSETVEIPDDPFNEVADITTTGNADIFYGFGATLGDCASLNIVMKAEQIDATYTYTVSVGDSTVTRGSLTEKININGLYPLHFNDEIVISISDSEGTEVATATFTFNYCLKALYNFDESYRQIAYTAYCYGVAAEAYKSAE